MAIAVDRIVRLSRGAELRFGWTVKHELFESSHARDAGLPDWLPELEGAAVSVDDIAADGCKLRLCSEKVCATARLSHAANDRVAFELRANRHVEGKPDAVWSWQHEGLRGMLGGKHDSYLAVERESGAVPFLRLRYTGSAIEVFALSAAFAHRLPKMIRSMAPGELKIGELTPPGAGLQVKRASPCGCG